MVANLQEFKLHQNANHYRTHFGRNRTRVDVKHHGKGFHVRKKKKFVVRNVNKILRHAELIENAPEAVVLSIKWKQMSSIRFELVLKVQLIGLLVFPQYYSWSSADR